VLLGRVVWPVQDDGAGFRAGGARALLRGRDLAEPSRRVRARALLRPQPAPCQSVSAAHLGADSVSDRDPVDAIQGGTEFDARVAVVLYAGIAGAMCLSWLVLFHVLSIHPYLVEEGVDPLVFPKERLRATLGVILYAVAGVGGWLSSPKMALLVFLALPIFYGITSEGLIETRLRLQFGRHRCASTRGHETVQAR
jgi:hypothetical protein